MRKLSNLLKRNLFIQIGVGFLLLAYSLTVGTRSYLSASDSFALTENDSNALLLANSVDYWSDVGIGDDEYDRGRLLSLSYGPGSVIGGITIPSIGVDSYVLSGASLDVLRRGVGHYESTALPGEEGNFVITAHRSSFGELFREADRLSEGDEITIRLPTGGQVVYNVTSSIIVSPQDTWVLDERGGSTLTLITCNPVDSTKERLIVYAELVDAPGAEVDFIREQNLTSDSENVTSLVGDERNISSIGTLRWLMIGNLGVVAAFIGLFHVKDSLLVKVLRGLFCAGSALFPLLYGIILI